MSFGAPCGGWGSARKAITKRAEVGRKLTKKTGISGKRCSSKRKLKSIKSRNVFVSVLRLLGKQSSVGPLVLNLFCVTRNF